MRWNIIRLIFRRELLDQIRDRRTLFMIVILPLLLYPLGGIGLMQLALGFFKKTQTVALVGGEHLASAPAVADPVALIGLASDPVTGRLAVEMAPLALLAADPPFLDDNRAIAYAADVIDDAAGITFVPFTNLDQAKDALNSRAVDLILVIEPGFKEKLQRNAPDEPRPRLELLGRGGDDRSRVTDGKLTRVLLRYREAIKEARAIRYGFPPHFDNTFDMNNPERAQPATRRATEDLFRVLSQVFPFVLVMWSLAGALYPAIDLCAGEKERGTMETLLISPASREEIVWGKFLTIWLFSAATALLNLLSMGMTTWYFSLQLPQSPFKFSILLWGTILLLPLSAFFSAISLAIGVYARSSKEGQYYLMPLFLITMPLIFLTLAPGVELNAFYSMVPVTGVALLLRALMAADSPSWSLAVYFVPVLAPMVVYSWLALRWAIEQFQREEVLFREAERLDVSLWFRSLFRDKEPLPGAGMALSCFVMVMGLLLLGRSLPLKTPLPVHVVVLYLAAVATPTLLLVVTLTTRPLDGLALRACSPGSLLIAVGLAGLLFLPGALATVFIFENIPGLKASLRDHLEHMATGAGPEGPAFSLMQLPLLMGLSLLVSACEELAFRGLILTGFSRRFRPATALLLSSFLFALFHMNVFQFLTHFLLGMVLGLLTQRTGSLFPAILFHFVYNSLVGVFLLFGPAWMPEVYPWLVGDGQITTLGLVLSGGCVLAATALLVVLLRRPVQLPPVVT